MADYTYNLWEILPDGTEIDHVTDEDRNNFSLKNLDEGSKHTFRLELLRDGKVVDKQEVTGLVNEVSNKVFNLYLVLAKENEALFTFDTSPALNGFAEIYLLDDISKPYEENEPGNNVDRVIDTRFPLDDQYSNTGSKDDYNAELVETRFVVDGLNPDTEYRVAVRTWKESDGEEIPSSVWAYNTFTTAASGFDTRDNTIILYQYTTGVNSINANVLPIYQKNGKVLDKNGNEGKDLADVEVNILSDSELGQKGFATVEFDGYYDDHVILHFKDDMQLDSSVGDAGIIWEGGGPDFKRTQNKGVAFVYKFKENWVPDLPSMFVEKSFNASKENPITALGELKLGHITDMSNWFYRSTSSDSKVYTVADLSNWDVSNVTSLHRFGHRLNNTASQFAGADLLGDLSKWNVNKVTNADYLFYQARIGAGAGLDNWCFDAPPTHKNALKQTKPTSIEGSIDWNKTC